jgi:hypothetical protein
MKYTFRGGRDNHRYYFCAVGKHMSTVVALISAALHLAIAVFQLLLALGKPWSEYAWGGQHRGVLPRGYPIGSVLAMLILLFFAWVNLATVALAPLPIAGVSLHTALKVVTGYAALGTLMNGISRFIPDCAYSSLSGFA